MICHYCHEAIPEAAKVYHDGSVWYYFCCFTDCYVLWKIQKLRRELAALEKLVH